jgi:hypothetical protein
LFTGKTRAGEKSAIVAVVFAALLLLFVAVGNGAMREVIVLLDEKSGSSVDFTFKLGSIATVFAFSIFNVATSLVMKKFCSPKRVEAQ